VSDFRDRMLDPRSERFGLSLRDFSGVDSFDRWVDVERPKMEFRFVKGFVGFVIEFGDSVGVVMS